MFYRSIITGRNEVVAKVMFLHVSVILFTGGLRRTPPPAPGRHPPRPGRPPLQGDPPAGRTPQPGRPPTRQGEPPWQGEPPRNRQTPPAGRTPTRQGEPTPREEDCSIRSMSGRYASYWNAFLFYVYVVELRFSMYQLLAQLILIACSCFIISKNVVVLIM